MAGTEINYSLKGTPPPGTIQVHKVVKYGQIPTRESPFKAQVDKKGVEIGLYSKIKDKDIRKEEVKSRESTLNKRSILIPDSINQTLGRTFHNDQEYKKNSSNSSTAKKVKQPYLAKEFSECTSEANIKAKTKNSRPQKPSSCNSRREAQMNGMEYYGSNKKFHTPEIAKDCSNFKHLTEGSLEIFIRSSPKLSMMQQQQSSNVSAINKHKLMLKFTSKAQKEAERRKQENQEEGELNEYLKEEPMRLKTKEESIAEINQVKNKIQQRAYLANKSKLLLSNESEEELVKRLKNVLKNKHTSSMKINKTSFHQPAHKERSKLQHLENEEDHAIQRDEMLIPKAVIPNRRQLSSGARIPSSHQTPKPAQKNKSVLKLLIDKVSERRNEIIKQKEDELKDAQQPKLLKRLKLDVETKLQLPKNHFIRTQKTMNLITPGKEESTGQDHTAVKKMRSFQASTPNEAKHHNPPMVAAHHPRSPRTFVQGDQPTADKKDQQNADIRNTHDHSQLFFPASNRLHISAIGNSSLSGLKSTRPTHFKSHTLKIDSQIQLFSPNPALKVSYLFETETVPPMQSQASEHHKSIAKFIESITKICNKYRRKWQLVDEDLTNFIKLTQSGSHMKQLEVRHCSHLRMLFSRLLLASPL